MTSKNRFTKTRPNPYHFSLVPESIWNPRKPYPALALSRILAGVAVVDKSYRTSTGREFVIPAGFAWLSIQTMLDDLSSALGQVIPRHKIKYALSNLRALDIVSTTLMEPETKGG